MLSREPMYSLRFTGGMTAAARVSSAAHSLCEIKPSPLVSDIANDFRGTSAPLIGALDSALREHAEQPTNARIKYHRIIERFPMAPNGSKAGVPGDQLIALAAIMSPQPNVRNGSKADISRGLAILGVKRSAPSPGRGAGRRVV